GLLSSTGVIHDLWYKNAVIYCLNVETFLDSNGDGIGDFVGLTDRLPYLAGLGVTCLWLLPFYASPNKDDGYDVSDYYGVHPRTGTFGEFVEFMNQARQLGLRVIVDLVVNHTSDQHPWFKAARRDPDSPYHSYYVWSKRRPKDWNKGMVFPGVQDTTWTRDPVSGDYYFHRFYDFQPDLNTHNSAVKEEINRIMGFWLQLGVSGFRMDAVPFVISHKGPHQPGPRKDYELLHELRNFLQWRRGDAMLLAEANVVPHESMPYFGDHGERLQMMLNFWVNQRMFYTFATSDARPLKDALLATHDRPYSAQWGMFLRTHDELDLGRLTDRQRRLVFDAFGPEKRMQLYGRGIRRRLAPMLGNDRRRIELANSLMFTLPGTPIIRYGDEIGMGDDLSLPERYAARTPMQWSHDRHGGFTTARRPIRRVVSDPIYGYKHVNVANQRRDPNSLLNWTERIIRTRKECAEIGWGEWTIVPRLPDHVLGLRYDWNGRATIVLHNFAERPCAVRLHVPDPEGRCLTNLLSQEVSERDGRGGHEIELEAYGYRWLRVGSLEQPITDEKTRHV
ncbi:MAG TPA: alpha-amylase family protein, partial [Vicinamibacterales bacterium]|nr:alpha-amylase family protein [Vicinamibacterales bacterium]